MEMAISWFLKVERVKKKENWQSRTIWGPGSSKAKSRTPYSKFQRQHLSGGPTLVQCALA